MGVVILATPARPSRPPVATIPTGLLRKNLLCANPHLMVVLLAEEGVAAGALLEGGPRLIPQPEPAHKPALRGADAALLEGVVAEAAAEAAVEEGTIAQMMNGLLRVGLGATAAPKRTQRMMIHVETRTFVRAT